MAGQAPVLTSWNPNKKHSDRERWICIYPAYLDSTKSRSEGRKVPKSKAVPTPTFAEIRDVLSAASMKVGVENKLYSREPSKELQHRGRVRVQLRNDDGTPINPKFTSRDSILLHLGEMIPQLKTRVNNPSGATAEPATSSQAASGGKKKKGNRR